MSSEKWICGRNEDDWDGYDEFDTKEEAIEWGRSVYQTYDVDGFLVGIKKNHELDKNIVDIDHILEHVNSVACDDMGENAEHVEDYLLDLEEGQKEELEKELNKAFHVWIRKHKLEPTFFEVNKVEEISLKK